MSRGCFAGQSPVATGKQGIDPGRIAASLADLLQHTRNGAHHPRQEPVCHDTQLDQLPCSRWTPPGIDCASVANHDRANRSPWRQLAIRPGNSFAAAGKGCDIVGAVEPARSIIDGLDIDRSMSPPDNRTSQRLARTRPDSVPVFTPPRIEPSVKSCLNPFDPLNSAVIRQERIERHFVPGCLPVRSYIRNTGDLSGRVDALIGSSCQYDSGLSSGQCRESVFKNRLDCSLTRLTLRTRKPRAIVSKDNFQRELVRRRRFAPIVRISRQTQSTPAALHRHVACQGEQSGCIHPASSRIAVR